MKIIIEYESSWRNSFLDGSNNEELPKSGRNFIGSMTTLKKEGNTALYASMFTYLGRVVSSKDVGYYPTCIIEEVQEGEDDGDW